MINNIKSRMQSKTTRKLSENEKAKNFDPKTAFSDMLYLDETPDIITGKDLKRAHEITINKLDKRLDKIFKEYNINLDEVTIKRDNRGKIKVEGDGPEVIRLNMILEEDKEFKKLYSKAQSLKAIIKTGKEHSEFSKLYNRDPRLAIERFAHLFENRTLNLFIIYEKGETTDKLKIT